jgi:hypothetical protein
MLCSFTQTYSNNRSELFYYHNKDKPDIYFRNKLDKNYYVFHNSPPSYKEIITQNSYFNDIKNIEIISYDAISYTDSFYKTLNKIKEDGYKYVFFLQDDVFSLVNEKIMDDLLEFVKNNSFDMLNIEQSNINTEAPIIFSNNSLKIYNTSSDDFKNKNLWAYCDGPYVANIDYLLNVVYDKSFFEKNDIWSAEWYLNQKITNKKIQRLSTNTNFFRRIGIVGPNAHSKKDELNFLNGMEWA